MAEPTTQDQRRSAADTPDAPEPRVCRTEDEIRQAAREHYRTHLAHKVTPAHAQRMGALLAESGLLRRRDCSP